MRKTLAFMTIIMAALSSGCVKKEGFKTVTQAPLYEPTPSYADLTRLEKLGVPDNCRDHLKKPAKQIPEFFNDEREAFRCGGMYTDKPWLYGTLMKTVEKKGWNGTGGYWALVFYYQYEKEPWAPQMFLKAVKLDPVGVFHFFTERISYNGKYGNSHPPAWYESRIPGLMSLLKQSIETSVEKGNGLDALKFLNKEVDFPDREALLESLIPELVFRENIRSINLVDIARQLREMNEPYAKSALDRLKADVHGNYAFFIRESPNF